MKHSEMPAAGLLDVLVSQTGCMYLSDLHNPNFLPAVQRALCRISPEQFELREWQDAVEYITGERFSFKSPKQAADYLKNYHA